LHDFSSETNQPTPAQNSLRLVPNYQGICPHILSEAPLDAKPFDFKLFLKNNSFF